MLYSGWSWFFRWFLIPPVFSKPLMTVPNTPTTIGINIRLMHFYFSSKVQVFVYLFAFFHSIVRWNGKIHEMINSFFSCQLTLGQGDPFVSQIIIIILIIIIIIIISSSSMSLLLEALYIIETCPNYVLVVLYKSFYLTEFFIIWYLFQEG